MSNLHPTSEKPKDGQDINIFYDNGLNSYGYYKDGEVHIPSLGFKYKWDKFIKGCIGWCYLNEEPVEAEWRKSDYGYYSFWPSSEMFIEASEKHWCIKLRGAPDNLTVAKNSSDSLDESKLASLCFYNAVFAILQKVKI